jgi:hypothetical protein
LDDLNRPELQNIVQQYLQDAIRYFQRKPFFFNDTDNVALASWTADYYVTQGATILVPAQAAAVVPPGPTWLPSNVYAAGDIIVDSNGNAQLAVVGGTSGTIQPGWATSAFSQTADNTVIWTLTSIAGTTAVIAVNLTAGIAGATVPTFTQTLYTVPTTLTSPPAFTPTLGTTPDNGCLWATVANYSGGIWTQLSTVPYQNQYTPPLDFVAPKRVEVTWSGNLRIGMTRIGYDELRDYDVIRPTPPTTYPTWWTWYQQLLYFWPYPVGFYPVTLSYRTAPPLPINATDANFWTQQGEALVRHYACGLILEAVVHDAEAAQEHYDLAKQELGVLIGERIAQTNIGEGSGIPATPW